MRSINSLTISNLIKFYRDGKRKNYNDRFQRPWAYVTWYSLNLEKSRHVWWSTVSCVWRYNALVQNLLMYGSMSELWDKIVSIMGHLWKHGRELTKNLSDQLTLFFKPSKWQLWKIIDKLNIGLGNYVRDKNFALTLQLLHVNNCLRGSLNLRTTMSTWK